jgi:hypothetical protein
MVATEGRTATYLPEVVRMAALRVALEQPSGALRVDGETLTAAANELLDDRATLPRAVLGGTEEPDVEPPIVSGSGFIPAPRGRPSRLARTASASLPVWRDRRHDRRGADGDSAGRS